MICTQCKKPFKVVEHVLPTLGTEEKEPVHCPYSGVKILDIISKGWVVSHKMSDTEIEEYFRNKFK